MPEAYIIEKFSSAVYGLATSPQPLQQRIAEAFIHDLIRAADEGALPLDVALQYQAYEKAWRAVGETDSKGGINTWASSLSVDQAVEIAKWIVNTEAKLRGEHRESNR